MKKFALNLDTLRLGTIEISVVGHCRGILRAGTAIFCGWAPQGYSACGWALLGYSAIGYCWDTLRLGTAEIFCGWVLQGSSAVEHCREILDWELQGFFAQLGTASIFCGWPLLGYFVVGHYKDILWLGIACWDTLRLGTAGIFCNWALQSGSGRAKTI